MLRSRIKKLHEKFLMKTRNNKFFDFFIRKPFLQFSSWFLYPEFRKQKLIFILLKKSIKPTLLITLLVLTSIYLYNSIYKLGEQSSQERIAKLEKILEITQNKLDSKKIKISEQQSTIERIRKQIGSRKYLEYIIKRDCHLRNPDYLSKLPDEIFFTIIDEIEKNKLPYTVFFRVIDFESGFQYLTNPSSGAFGYCQLLPSTFRLGSKILNLKENTPVNNVKIGAWVLKSGFDRWKKRGLNDRDAWFNSLVNYCGGSHSLAEKEMMYFKDDLFEIKQIVERETQELKDI